MYFVSDLIYFVYMKKNTSKQWLVLGLVFVLILFIFAYLINSKILYVSGGAYDLISAVFGFGGFLFIIIGVVKLMIGKLRE